MAQGPEVPQAQIKLRELMASRAKNGWHPDGSTGTTDRSFPLPKANKRDKYTRGKPSIIPNSRPISGVNGKYT